MAGNVKGLTVELAGETRGLEAALKDLGKSANTINKELGQVERGLKFDPSNTVLLAQKQGLLADKIAVTRDHLDSLRQAQARVDAMYASGEIDDGQYRAFQRDLETTKSKLVTFEKQLKDVDVAQEKAATSANKLGDQVDKAGDKAKAGGSKISAAMSSIASSGPAAVAVAVLAVGTAAFTAGEAALENADALQVMADATGLSAERLQELQYIGKDVGVELDTIAGAQARLSKAMYAAKDGTGTQADVFKKLGVNVVDGSGNLRDAKVVMGEAFDALSKMGNETERDAMAMAIFGKSAQDLNPLLKLGADGMAAMSEKARDAGAVMSDETVAGLDAFGDSLDQLKQGAMAGFGEAFADLLPGIQPILDAINGGAGLETLFPPEVQAQLDELGASIGVFNTTVMPQISAWFDEFIGPTMDEIRAAFDAVAMEVIPTITAIVDFVTANWPAIQRVIEPIMTAVREIVAGVMLQVSGVIRTVMAAIRGDWGAAWEGIKTVFSGILSQIIGLLRMTTFAQAISSCFEIVKRVGPWFSDMKDSVLGVIRDLLAKLRGPVDTIRGILENLNPFQRHSPSLVDNVLAGVDVIRNAYASLGGMQLGGPVLAGVGAGYGAASVSSIRTSSSTTNNFNGNFMIDASKLSTPDFDSLIASIQMAKRMG